MFDVLIRVQNTHAVRSPCDFLNFLYYCEHYRNKTQHHGKRTKLLGKIAMLVTGCGFVNTAGRALFHDMLNSILLTFKCDVLRDKVPLFAPTWYMSHTTRFTGFTGLDKCDHDHILAV